MKTLRRQCVHKTRSPFLKRFESLHSAKIFISKITHAVEIPRPDKQKPSIRSENALKA